ncbi:unnamed protein product [Schistosoma rodhaini]|uniref:Uncharacterized protein n=1 Tax=Schistosoma rodhaini TaxID=6188 RepID=A0AA85FSE6_9TREM|nr:unnamed protein product [Schistosoma rodhaini]CAH8558540.1 unnamed protein product [Schistosoma rodhaini]
MPLYNDEDLIIIDPGYENVTNFRKDYDYDLIGKAISLRASFLRNPAGYLHNLIEQHTIELLFTSLICFGIFLGVVVLLFVLKKFIHHVKLIKLLVKEFNSARLQLKEIKKENLPMNYDIYAKAVFTVLINYYQLFKGNENRIIPEDLVEYEIIRFVLEAAWKNTISCRQLYNIELYRSTEDESIKGLLEDDSKNVIDNLNDVVDHNINSSRTGKKSDINHIPDDNVNFVMNKMYDKRTNKQNLSNKSVVKPWYENKNQIVMKNIINPNDIDSNIKLENLNNRRHNKGINISPYEYTSNAQYLE